MSVRNKVRAAFTELRKEGFFARMNFSCCQNCGWSAVPADIPNVIFYHAQDAEAYNSVGNLRFHLYMAHQGNSARAVEVLTKHGLQIQWDGTDRTRIAVTGER